MGFGAINIDTAGIGSIMTGAGSLIKDVRSAITGEISPEKKGEIEAKLAEIGGKLADGQMAVNKIEASHASLFVSGWRPAVGWVCVLGLFMHFIVNPMILWYAKLTGMALVPPTLDIGELITMLLGILGLGAYRTYEKQKGVNKKH